MTQSDREADHAARAAYFDMLAELGVTKHLGSLKATEMLVDLTHLDAESLVLDVGCGIGLTASYLARHYGCRVVGVDVTPKMLRRAKEEARRRRVGSRVSFAVGDAQALPFAEGTFDVVMAESVAIFLADRPLGFREWARVTRSGGYVGVTESTWLERRGRRADRFMKTLGAVALQKEDWVALMAQAGLEDVSAGVYRVNLRDEARGRLKRFGVGGLVRAANRAVSAILLNPRARRLLGQARVTVPRRVLKSMGYGIYAGRKP